MGTSSACSHPVLGPKCKKTCGTCTPTTCDDGTGACDDGAYHCDSSAASCISTATTSSPGATSNSPAATDAPSPDESSPRNLEPTWVPIWVIAGIMSIWCFL